MDGFRLSVGFESGFGFELPGFRFGFKKIEMDSYSSGFRFKVSGFGFEMSGFAHHCFVPDIFVFML